ncbi:MAG: hypothetical protein HW421_1104 [Ignavibacteria bacterium]|nr:hypothetical protein [Ignavibacteria bacterium]
MKKIMLYPFWVRFWHWLNAFLFLVLIVSGISLHYSEANSIFVSFQISMFAHNTAGILLSVVYLFYIIKSLFSGNYKNYIPKFRGLIGSIRMQTRYYLLGIFSGEEKPFHPAVNHKFNPMQQLAYIGVMGIMMPVIILTGWLMLFPELSPDEFLGMGGIWPMAILHIVVGFFLSVFMLAHIYLGTTGHTVSELFHSMLNGWHLTQDTDTDIDEYALDRLQSGKRKRLLPIVFYNPLTVSGTFTAIIGSLVTLFLLVLDFFSQYTKAYMGIITFVLVPSIMLLGILLVIIGMFIENRKLLIDKGHERKLPIIDLNNTKHQVATLFFVVGAATMAAFSVIGTMKAYDYTNTEDFCGNTCHKVMEPVYTAYMDSPHSRVGCVKCHINPNASWSEKSKLSGISQVYSTFFNKFPKPIPTPITNLRPNEQTCEQCHWIRQFYSEKKMVFDFFTSDEKNTETKLAMHIKIGGGTQELGNNAGIHWHMIMTNEVAYYASDKERMSIPVIKSRNLQTGKEIIYRDSEVKIPDDSLKEQNFRIMDCMDCHNRQSHVFYQPNKIVNTYMSLGKIDRTIPYIKNLSVQALEGHATSRMTAYNDIKNFIWKFYDNNYPLVLREKKSSILSTIDQLNKIYLRNYFPENGVSWRKFPNNIGHLYSPGCFRCHDGNHKTPEGKVLSSDCNICHSIIEQKAPNGQVNTMNEKGEIDFIHPGGIDKFIGSKLCYKCHGAKR